jgi:hypothetical protein
LTCPDLPGCELTGTATFLVPIITDFGGGPAASFGGVGGSPGGFPRAFPKPTFPNMLKPIPKPAPALTPRELQTGDQLLQDLLNQPISTSTQSELDQLLAGRTFLPQGGIVTGTESAANIFSNILSKLLSPFTQGLSMLMYSEDAGLPQDVESQRVTDFITAANAPPQGPPNDTTTLTLGSNLGLPDVAPLTPEQLAPVGQLAELGVTASRVPAPLLAPQFQPDPFGLPGDFTVSGAEPIAKPRPRTAPSLAAQPAALLSPEGLLSTAPGSPAGSPSLASSPLAAPGPNERPSPATASDCQSKSSKKSKKKRKPRDVCYRGVYEERANGLLKFKREKIPCR